MSRDDEPPRGENATGVTSRLPNALEALKMLTDWSKWCAAIATAAIAASASTRELGEDSWLRTPLFCSSIGFFLVSVFAAAMLLLAAPAIAQRLPPPPGKDIFHMGMYEGVRGWPVYIYTWAQFLGLFLGLVCFVAVIVAKLLDP